MGRARSFHFLISIAVMAVVLATAAHAQTAPSTAPPTPPAPSSKGQDRALTPDEAERMFGDMNKASGVRMYEGLCGRAKEFVAKKGAVADPLLSQFNTMVGSSVVNALLNYCATGRFVLNFYDGNDGKCRSRVPLAPSHVQLITRLPFVRASDVEIIAMSCVETDQTIFLLNAHAHSILINDAVVGGINITGGVLASNILIQDTTVNGQVAIEGMTIGSSLEIARSTLGKEGSKTSALSIFQSSIGALMITNTRINGTAYIGDNQFKGNAQIGRYTTAADAPQDIMIFGNTTVVRNDVKGHLRITGAQINGNLDLEANFVERAFYVGGRTVVTGWLNLFASRALTMELYDMEVDDTVHAVAMRINETLYVGQSSSGQEKVNFKKTMNLKNLKADRLLMASATIGEQLTLISTTTNDVDISDTTIGKKIHAGDARVRVFNVRNSTIPAFECSDCEVAQYMMLGARFSGEVNLRGAQIRASLIFRDGDDNNASSWGPGSRLDLRSIQIETIEADICDLRVKPEGGEKCSGPIVPTLINGAKFKNILPGRRPTTAAPPSANEKTNGLLDQDTDLIVSWIRASRGNEQFQPQPYDLVADALDRAGRHRQGIDVRIAKLDDDYATGHYWWGKRAAAKAARYFVGYGYHNEYSVVVFVALVAVGMVVFLLGRHVSPVHMHELRLVGFVNVLWYSFWFSIDRAVPPLHIDETMKEYSVLKPGARAYFYFHRGIGMVTLSFFVAGITGLFK